jgi:hypothetical protein
MVTLQTNGQRLVVSSRPFARRRAKFDPWLAHAVSGLALTDDPGFPVQPSVWASEFTLKSGDVFHYFVTTSQYPVEAPLAVDYDQFQAPNIGGFHTGESYNYVWRPAATYKIPDADWAAFIAALRA